VHDVAPTPKNLFSFSRLKTFHQCPLRYRYRYLKGLKESFRSIESFLGNVVHDVLQWLYEDHTRDAGPELEEILEELDRRWRTSWQRDVAVVRLSDSPEDALRSAREMLERFHRDTYRRDRSETLALEQRYSQRLSPEVVFTGFADRVGRTDKGRLFIVDYKTSKSTGDPSEFSEGLQAPLYASCALEHHGESEALAGYHYLRHGKTRWQTVSSERGRQLLDRFLGLAEEARTATDFPARPGILCAWCGFNHICAEARIPDDLAGGLNHSRSLR
jgi:ATP-dependent helicase/DNAse subunit B